MRNYAFIDSQNLNLGVQSLGWDIDYKKLRLYLKNKFQITKAFIFIGFVQSNQELYKKLQDAGFLLIFKPTVEYLEKGKSLVKGNVDAELVLHCSAIEYSHYDKALIVSGDGDFSCLIEYLTQNKKLLKLLTPNSKYSKLLKPYSSSIVQIDKIISSFGIKKKKTKTSIGGRSKP